MCNQFASRKIQLYMAIENRSMACGHKHPRLNTFVRLLIESTSVTSKDTFYRFANK